MKKILKFLFIVRDGKYNEPRLRALNPLTFVFLILALPYCIIETNIKLFIDYFKFLKDVFVWW